jgi:serine protease Do
VTRELAESFGLNKPQGALISRILPESPAAKAGFEVGDIILKFNGKKINRSSALPPIVGRTTIGKSVPVIVMRNNERKTLHVKVEQLPEEDEVAQYNGQPNKLTDQRLAIEVADLTKEQKQQFNIEGGVAVVSVESGAAADAGIRRGDIISSINNKKVTDAKQFLDIAKKLPEDKAIPVLIQRGQGAIFLALRIEKSN